MSFRPMYAGGFDSQQTLDSWWSGIVKSYGGDEADVDPMFAFRHQLALAGYKGLFYWDRDTSTARFRAADAARYEALQAAHALPTLPAVPHVDQDVELDAREDDGTPGAFVGATGAGGAILLGLLAWAAMRRR